MTYPDNKTIENWIFNCKLADFEFSTTKKRFIIYGGRFHARTIWIRGGRWKNIAVGHHRTETLKLLSEENTDTQNTSKIIY
jgi:hypothetical protein